MVALSRPTMIGRLLAAAAIALPEALHGAGQEYTVALTVRDTTWMPGSRFDRTDFVDRCANAGVRVVQGPFDEAIADADVSYRAYKGSPMTLFGVGREVIAYGTNIMYRLDLRSRKANSHLLRVDVFVNGPGGRVGADLAARAARLFKTQPGYVHSCAAIAAALGNHAAAVRLLPWAVVSNDGMKLLKWVRFEPANDRERAYLALARRDFRTLRRFGSEAVDPILVLFDASTGIGSDSTGYFEWGSSGTSAILATAAGFLTEPGDGRAARVLTAFLDDNKGGGIWKHLNRVFVAVLGALGRVGDSSVVGTLEHWSQQRAPVGPAAVQALTTLRARLGSSDGNSGAPGARASQPAVERAEISDNARCCRHSWARADTIRIELQDRLGVRTELIVGATRTNDDLLDHLGGRSYNLPDASGRLALRRDSLWYLIPWRAVREVTLQSGEHLVSLRDATEYRGRLQTIVNPDEGILPPGRTPKVYHLANATRLVVLAIQPEGRPQTRARDDQWTLTIAGSGAPMTVIGAFAFQYYSTSGYAMGGSDRETTVRTFRVVMRSDTVVANVSDFESISHWRRGGRDSVEVKASSGVPAVRGELVLAERDDRGEHTASRWLLTGTLASGVDVAVERHRWQLVKVK